MIATHCRARYAGRVGHSRQSSRRLGEWRGGSDFRHGALTRRSAQLGRTAQAGLEAEAHDHLLRVGRRRVGAAGLDRMGGDPRDELQQQAVALSSTPMATGADFSTPAARTICKQFVNAVARDIEDPRRIYPYSSALIFGHFARQRCGRTQQASEEQRASRWSARRWIRLFGVPRLRRIPRSISSFGGEDEGINITPSTTIFTGTRISTTPIFPTDALCANRRHRHDAHGRRRFAPL